MDYFFIAIIVLLWIAVLFNLALTLGLAKKLSNSQLSKTLAVSHQLKKGDKAPAFQVQTLDGEAINSEEIFPKSQTILLFISPYCRPCRDKMPYFRFLLPKAKQQGWQLLFISDGTYEDTSRFAQEFNLDTHVVMPSSPHTFLWESYGVEGMPFYCLIDRQGKVQSVGQPDAHYDEWKTIVNSWETTSPKLDLVPSMS